MRVLAVLKLDGDVCVALAVDPPRALLELVLRTQPRRLCARRARRCVSTTGDNRSFLGRGARAVAFAPSADASHTTRIAASSSSSVSRSRCSTRRASATSITQNCAAQPRHVDAGGPSGMTRRASGRALMQTPTRAAQMRARASPLLSERIRDSPLGRRVGALFAPRDASKMYGYALEPPKRRRIRDSPLLSLLGALSLFGLIGVAILHGGGLPDDGSAMMAGFSAMAARRSLAHAHRLHAQRQADMLRTAEHAAEPGLTLAQAVEQQQQRPLLRSVSEPTHAPAAVAPVISDTSCVDERPECASWASRGECAANPAFMRKSCARSCDECEFVRALAVICHRRKSLAPSLRPGGLNAMFERLVSAYSPRGTVTVVSSPPRGPWVITIDDFMEDDEVDALLDAHVGGGRFERSLAGDETTAYRTSSTSWCNVPACEGDPRIQRLRARVEKATGIPADNAEHIQTLRYEPGEFYRPHHDQNAEPLSAWGPRMLTFFLYLNTLDEDAGGHDNKRRQMRGHARAPLAALLTRATCALQAAARASPTSTSPYSRSAAVLSSGHQSTTTTRPRWTDTPTRAPTTRRCP